MRYDGVTAGTIFAGIDGATAGGIAGGTLGTIVGRVAGGNRRAKPRNPDVLAKRLPSWPSSPEIRKARAKLTDFRFSDFSLNGHRRPVVVPKSQR